MKQTELGLGHSYSRGKVKFNINRVDNMIIQSIALIDQLDKDINTFAMRIKYVFLMDFYVCYHLMCWGVRLESFKVKTNLQSLLFWVSELVL